MNKQERRILESINRVLQDSQIAKQIDQIADRIERDFETSSDLLAWETVPMELFFGRLPQIIRSSWVFLLKQGCVSGAERHPNSHQRVRSWRRKGDFQIWIDDRWESHILENTFDLPLQQQWATIPENVWHQAVVEPGEHWIVISFHTAKADALIEERPDSRDNRRMRQRLYARPPK